MDSIAAKQASRRHRAGQQHLLRMAHHQARLMSANAYDHLVTMGRALGSDGAMSLYSHTTLSRSVCEAAVRFTWLLDCSVGYEERITRSAAALFGSATYRLKGAKEIPMERMGPGIQPMLIDKCNTEYDEVRRLVDSAGMRLALDRNGKKVARIELPDAAVKVPIKLDIGPLMGKLLPES